MKQQRGSTLAQLSTQVIIDHHFKYADDELASISPDWKQETLATIRDHKTLRRFMRVFGTTNQADMLKRLTWKRWDSSHEYRGAKNYNYTGEHMKDISTICLIPGGVAMGTLTGQLILSTKDSCVELPVNKSPSSVLNLVYYYDNRLFAVSACWKIFVWDREVSDEGECSWVPTIEYVDRVANGRWVRLYMHKGKFLLHVSEHNVNLYKLMEDDARIIWTSPYNGMYVSDASMSENHMAIIMVRSMMANLRPGIGNDDQLINILVIARMDRLRISINVPLDPSMVPRRVIVQENDNKDGWIYVAYTGGMVEQYAYGYVLKEEGDIDPVLSTTLSDRLLCGDENDIIVGMSCHKGRLSIVLHKSTRHYAIEVYNVSPFELIRKFDLKDFCADPPTHKKRRVVHCGVDLIGTDMNHSRLACYNNKSQRVHVWDFSE